MTDSDGPPPSNSSAPMRYRARLYEHYTRHDVPPSSVAGFAPRAPYLSDLIARHFPADRGASVLDLGCGHGALLHFAREAGYVRLAGVDGSAAQVAAARTLGIAGVREGDIFETLRGTADGSVDVVVAFDVVEHFTRDEILDFIDAVRRVLAPGGRFIVHVPNGESPFHGGIRYGDATHEFAYTRRSISHLLLASGFARVDCFEDAPKVHGVKSAIRAILWKGIRAGFRLILAAETGETGSAAIFTQNLLAVAHRGDEGSRRSPSPY